MAGNYAVSIKNKSILSIIQEADIVVQLVVLVLVLASIWSWAIILNKTVKLRMCKRRHSKFMRRFNSDATMSSIHEAVKNSVVSPVEYIFVATMTAVKRYGLKEDHGRENAVIQDKIDTVMTNARDRSIDELESGLGYLATIASTAPFIGLFGTVWGIMRSFQAIAFSKNTSLAVVAPGIAEALFATALGLVVAIPALMFYNILLGKVSAIETYSNDFLLRLHNKIESVYKL